MRRKGRLAAVLALALCCLACTGSGSLHQETFTLAPAEKPVTNPLKGWAPWNGNQREDFDSTLAFVSVSWRELEPEQGVYAFDQMERAHQIDQLRRQGVRLVLRVVCDYPGEEPHLDIPDWLYEETGGTWYEGEYGSGCSPDYRDPAFLEAHGRLLEALGQRYDHDPYVAYIQLGSLGHWGEWHVDEEAGIDPFPSQEVTDCYVEQYRAAFPHKQLMLRRPYGIGAELGLGLYNDAFAQTGSHQEWLGWIADGYRSSENGEQLDGMPDFWHNGASGGEFATDRDVWAYVLEDYEATLEYIRSSHTSWIGPRCFGSETLADLPPEQRDLAAARVNALSQELGYCFAVTQVQVRQWANAPDLNVTLTVENMGVAPIYENWPLCLRLVDPGGAVLRQEMVDGRITKWLPGTNTFSYTFAGSGSLPPGHYSLQLGIVDPITGQPGIRLANSGETEPCLYQLAAFEKRY